MHTDGLILLGVSIFLYCVTIYLSVTKDNKISRLERNLKDDVRKNTEEYISEFNNLSSLIAKCVNDFDCSFNISGGEYMWCIRIYRIYKGEHFSKDIHILSDKLNDYETLKNIYEQIAEVMSDKAVEDAICKKYDNWFTSTHNHSYTKRSS